MTDHIEEFLRKVDQHLTMEGAQRQQVLSELRSHLWETVTEIQHADPSRSQGEIERQVVADFGSPADLAIAYNPEGSVVLTDASGTTVLTFSAAATRAGRVAGEVATKSAKAVGKGATVFGRGVGGVLKVALITIAVIVAAALLSASLVAVFLFDDIKAVVENNIEDTVYNGDFDDCSRSPCDETLEPKRFYVHDDAKRLRFWLSGHGHGNETEGGGRVQVIVTDPTGVKVMDASFDVDPGESFSEAGLWAPIAGNWTIEVRYEDFRGNLHLRVDVAGLPR